MGSAGQEQHVPQESQTQNGVLFSLWGYGSAELGAQKNTKSGVLYEFSDPRTNLPDFQEKLSSGQKNRFFSPGKRFQAL